MSLLVGTSRSKQLQKVEYLTSRRSLRYNQQNRQIYTKLLHISQLAKRKRTIKKDYRRYIAKNNRKNES